VIRLAVCLFVLFFQFALPCSPLWAEPEEDFIWGINGHPFVQRGYRPNADGVPYEDQIRLVAHLGMTYYRADVALADATYQQSQQWLECLLALGQQYRVEILPVIFPPVDLDGEIQKNPPDLEGVYQTGFLTAKEWALRFRGRIPVYEVHNELDVWCMILDYWGLGNPPNGDHLEHYYPERLKLVASLLKGMIAGIRTGDPTAKTMINAAGWLHTGFIQAMVNEEVDFDILGWHWYSSEPIDNIESQGGRDLLAELEAFGKPIWITEGNYLPGLDLYNGAYGHPNSEGFEGMQAGLDYLQQTLPHMWELRNRGFLQAYFVYELLDEPYFLPGQPDTREAWLGLVEIVPGPSGAGWRIRQRKPAFYVVRDLIQACSGP